jgi:hypothetical protein
VKTFKIDVPDAVLSDLTQRLSLSRWPDALEDAGWDYGTDLDYARELCEYWQNDFDWRSQERLLNLFPAVQS